MLQNFLCSTFEMTGSGKSFTQRMQQCLGNTVLCLYLDLSIQGVKEQRKKGYHLAQLSEATPRTILYNSCLKTYTIVFQLPFHLAKPDPSDLLLLGLNLGLLVALLLAVGGLRSCTLRSRARGQGESGGSGPISGMREGHHRGRRWAR